MQTVIQFITGNLIGNHSHSAFTSWPPGSPWCGLGGGGGGVTVTVCATPALTSNSLTLKSD